MALMALTTIGHARVWLEAREIVRVHMHDAFNCAILMASGETYYVPKQVYDAEYHRLFPAASYPPKKVS